MSVASAALGAKPQRMLEPAVVAKDRVFGMQALVNGRGAERPGA